MHPSLLQRQKNLADWKVLTLLTFALLLFLKQCKQCKQCRQCKHCKQCKLCNRALYPKQYMKAKHRCVCSVYKQFRIFDGLFKRQPLNRSRPVQICSNNTLARASQVVDSPLPPNCAQSRSARGITTSSTTHDWETYFTPRSESQDSLYFWSENESMKKWLHPLHLTQQDVRMICRMRQSWYLFRLSQKMFLAANNAKLYVLPE